MYDSPTILIVRLSAIGDTVLLIPGHIDPAINLHDALVVWTGSKAELWPVDGRRQAATLMA